MDLPSIPFLNLFINFFLGVPIFFTMCGFLIWNSIGRSKSFNEYLQKRFWRIYPELWVAVAFELFVLVILYHEKINWLQFGAFAFTQSTIFQFWTPDCLRGYGCGCPNGSLWTICVLIQFYFVAFYLYRFLHGKKLIHWVFSFIISLLISLSIPVLSGYLPEIVGKLLSQTILPYFWMFLVPAYIAEKKDIVLPVLIKYWWVFLIATLFFKLGYKHDTWLLFFVMICTCVLSWISTKTVGEYCINRKMSVVNK